MRAGKFAALIGLALSCLSPQLVYALGAVAVEGGSGDSGTKRYGIALQWDWEVQWLRLGDWHLGGYWELSASYWDGDDGRTGNDSLGEFGFSQVFRWQTQTPIYGVMPYLEAGAGVHGMTDTELGDKNFDTELAFGSHGGGRHPLRARGPIRDRVPVSASIESRDRRFQSRYQFPLSAIELSFLVTLAGAAEILRG